MIYYHPGTPGEVSDEAAHAYVDKLVRNPFTTGLIWYMIADYGPTSTRRNIARGRPLCAPGAMLTYLQAAAVRERFQGEGS
jgi:hypothetical protein